MTILGILTILIVILISMTLHEAMHGFMAYALGDDTAKAKGRLTLNPIKHIDPFLTVLLPLLLAVAGAPIFGGAKPVPFNPARVRYGEWGAALVALAGPLTNFILAFICFGLYAITRTESISQYFLLATTVNLGFFVFNMIPLPPLDGSRVLYALAPEFVQRGMEALERYGLIIVFGLVLIASSVISTILITCIQTILGWFALIFSIT